MTDQAPWQKLLGVVGWRLNVAVLAFLAFAFVDNEGDVVYAKRRVEKYSGPHVLDNQVVDVCSEPSLAVSTA
jgi:hypothetical protein